jgi:tetratricopeptide (TPR) repeat protein
MKRRFRLITVALLLLPALSGIGCSKIKAKAAYKDGNKLYKAENFKKAIEQYERAIELDPDLPEAHFYLGNSHQALYRPGKEGADNKAHLETAIAHYKKSLEVNPGSSDHQKTLKRNALGFLSAIYSDEPYKNFELAHKYAGELVSDAPTDVKAQFTLASLYEKFEHVDEAEKLYKKVAEENPQDAKACGALAGFYNKPLWAGQAKFDDAVSVLDRCASLNPGDETGYYKIATFYWDKAFRDPMLTGAQKDQYADKGLEAIDKALSLKADYIEAIIYKNLLYRVKASVAPNSRQAQQFLDQANALRDQATELRKAALNAQAESGPLAQPKPESGS